MNGKIERTELGEFLEKSSPYSTRNVIKKEFLRSPHIFNHTTKHPQRKHIKKYMLNISMHEHIGYELVNSKIRSQKKMKSEDIIKIKR